MTVTKRNTAEGQANATPLTAANSGGASGDAFSSIGGAGGTCTFSTAQFMHGSQSYLMSATSGNTFIPAWTFPATPQLATQFFFRLLALPTNPVTLAQIRNATGNAAKITINAANKLQIQDATGTSLTTFATILAINTWYRVEVEAQPGTTIANGTINAGYYLGDAAEGSPVDARYASGATVNAGITGLTTFQPGIAATAAAGTFQVYYDDPSYTVGSITPIGVGASTVPGAPTGVIAIANAGGAAVAYTAPASNGGSAITQYTLTVIDVITGVQVTFTDLASPTAVTGLVNGKVYSVTVHATNAIGNSAESAAVLFTPGDVPGAPTAVVASAGTASALVSFTPPVSSGGSMISSYTVTSTPGGLIGTGAASPINVVGLTNGTAYTFTVHATNSSGNSAESVASGAVTPVSVPNVVKARRSGAWVSNVPVKIRRSGAWIQVL